MPDSTNSDIFNSAPSLLIGETAEQFEFLRAELEQEIKPQGIIERNYVNDVLLLIWEISRLRRFKVNIIFIARLNALEMLLVRIDLGLARGIGADLNNEAKRLALGWLEKNGDEEIVRQILAQSGLDESAIDAAAFKRSLPEIQEIDDMLAFTEARLEKTLRRISKYRKGFGRQIRSSVDQVLARNDSLIPANDSLAA
jgi:hypothetical protein